MVGINMEYRWAKIRLLSRSLGSSKMDACGSAILLNKGFVIRKLLLKGDRAVEVKRMNNNGLQILVIVRR